MPWTIRALRLAWWAGLAVLVGLPLYLSLRADRPGSGMRDVLREGGLLSGVLALSLLVAAVVLPSRLSLLNRAFGIEKVLRGHRRTALVALVIVVAHLALVMVADPENLHLLDVRTAPDRARAATGATVALALLCLATFVRALMRRRYTWWRILHVLLAVTVLVLSALHVFWLNHLVRDHGMRMVFTVIALGLIAMLAHRWVWEPVVARSRPYVVDEVRHENATTSTLVLSPRHGYQPGIRFEAGQFAWIRLDHPFALREEHPFTIASGAHDHRRIEFTVREAGDFTRRLRRLEPGRLVYLDGPHGSFTPDDHGRTRRGAVMIAAGVGITPMISMLRTFAHRGDDAPHLLVYAASTEADLLFQPELERLRSVLRLHVVTIVSRPGPDWTGHTGRIDAALLRSQFGRRRRHGRHVFVCGPGPMVTSTLELLRDLGVPGDEVHTELFDMGTPPRGRPVPAPAPATSHDPVETWTGAITLLPRDVVPRHPRNPQHPLTPADPTVPVRHR